MAFLRAAVWGVPLLLLLLAAAVVAARGRVALIGGLEAPYPDDAAPAPDDDAAPAPDDDAAPVAAADPTPGADREPANEPQPSEPVD